MPLRWTFVMLVLYLVCPVNYGGFLYLQCHPAAFMHVMKAVLENLSHTNTRRLWFLSVVASLLYSLGCILAKKGGETFLKASERDF